MKSQYFLGAPKDVLANYSKWFDSKNFAVVEVTQALTMSRLEGPLLSIIVVYLESGYE